jgi:transcriptional regulator with XRE-family HTH domain
MRSLFVNEKGVVMSFEKAGLFMDRARSRLGENLHRVMAQQGLTIAEVVRRTGLDDRTIKAMLRNSNTRPHARTLHQLAEGLGIHVDELFQNPTLLARRLFDRRTNPMVDEVAARNPHLFDGWTIDDFDDLYSRFGTGGELTIDGTIEAVRAINLRRSLFNKVALLLETGQSRVLQGMVDLLYEQVVLRGDASSSAAAEVAGGASTPRAEDSGISLDDAPTSAALFDDERSDDGVGGQIGGREMPADVAR